MPGNWWSWLLVVTILLGGPAIAGVPAEPARPQPVASSAIVQPDDPAEPLGVPGNRVAMAPRSVEPTTAEQAGGHDPTGSRDTMSTLFVFMLATFIGIGVIRRVSRLLHTPLMSLTNAISAIAVVGAIMLAGGEKYPLGYRIAGMVAIFASMMNVISGFLITDRMLKMFKTRPGGKP